MHLLFLQITIPNNTRNIKKEAVTITAPHIPPITGARLCLSGKMVPRGVTVIFVISDVTILVNVNMY